MYLVSEFQFLVPPFMLYRMHGIYGGLPSWRNPAKHPTSPHGSMAAGDCSDAAVQGLCAGRGMVEARGRSCWGTAGAHRSKQRSYVRLRRNTGPKATRHPAWECWQTGKLQSTESPCAADFSTAAVWCVPFSGTVGLINKLQTQKSKRNIVLYQVFIK